MAPITGQNYPALAGGMEVVENIRQNLGGESVSPQDLNRIKVPAGGGTSWVVTDADGEETSAKSIEGIIVHIARRRAYWPDANPSGDPPQCASVDCVIGIGEPGGECATCPLNQFGSSHKGDGSTGRGKACKETKLLFLLREGCLLPDVVVVPAASLKAIKQYQLKLANTAPYWGVVTRLELTRTQNRDGISYAQITPKKAGTLDREAAAGILKYAQALQTLFSSVEVGPDDVDDGPQEV